MKHSRQPLKASAAMLAIAGILLSSCAVSRAETPAPGQAQVAEDVHSGYYREPGAGAMIIDGLIVRPVSLVATVIGGAVYVVTLPFSALGGNAGEAGEKLVVNPAEYTFTRCLGCFNRWP